MKRAKKPYVPPLWLQGVLDEDASAAIPPKQPKYLSARNRFPRPQTARGDEYGAGFVRRTPTLAFARPSSSSSAPASPTAATPKPTPSLALSAPASPLPLPPADGSPTDEAEAGRDAWPQRPATAREAGAPPLEEAGGAETERPAGPGEAVERFDRRNYFKYTYRQKQSGPTRVIRSQERLAASAAVASPVDALTFQRVFKHLKPADTALMHLSVRRARSHFLRGYERMTAVPGDVEGAIEAYSEAVRLDDRFFGALLNRGFCYVAAGNWPAARADFDEALRAVPDSPLALYNRAGALIQLGECQRALADIERCQALASPLVSAADLAHQRALACRRAGDMKESMESYRDAFVLARTKLPSDFSHFTTAKAKWKHATEVALRARPFAGALEFRPPASLEARFRSLNRPAAAAAANRFFQTVALRQAVKRAIAKASEERSEADIALLTEALAGVDIFARLSPEVMREVARCVKLVCVDRNQILVKQGEPAEDFYIVFAGSGVVLKKDPSRIAYGGTNELELIGRVETGHVLGEIALLQGTTRSATVVTQEYSEFLRLSAEEYRRCIRALHEGELARRAAFLKDVPLFRPVPPEDLRKLAVVMRPLTFRRHERVVDIGEPALNLFVVLSGTLEVEKALSQPPAGPRPPGPAAAPSPRPPTSARRTRPSPRPPPSAPSLRPPTASSAARSAESRAPPTPDPERPRTPHSPPQAPHSPPPASRRPSLGPPDTPPSTAREGNWRQRPGTAERPPAGRRKSAVEVGWQRLQAAGPVGEEVTVVPGWAAIRGETIGEHLVATEWSSKGVRWDIRATVTSAEAVLLSLNRTEFFYFSDIARRVAEETAERRPTVAQLWERYNESRRWDAFKKAIVADVALEREYERRRTNFSFR